MRRAVAWGTAAFILTAIHPVSFRTGLVIAIIASLLGTIS